MGIIKGETELEGIKAEIYVGEIDYKKDQFPLKEFQRKLYRRRPPRRVNQYTESRRSNQGNY